MIAFVSCLTYELGKQLGVEAAAAEFSRQLASPDDESLPAARVVARLRDLADLCIYHGAGTCLPKARSRAAHAALKWLGAEQGGPHRGVWIMIDDDVETDHATLRRLLTLAGDSRVAVLPCAVRGMQSEQHTVNCVWESNLIALHDGVQCRQVRRGGCGLMIVPHRALARVTDRNAKVLTWRDHDDEDKVALFQTVFPTIDGHSRWLGEDYSFCERLRDAGVEIVAPLEGISVHDGIGLDLRRCAP